MFIFVYIYLFIYIIYIYIHNIHKGAGINHKDVQCSAPGSWKRPPFAHSTLKCCQTYSKVTSCKVTMIEPWLGLPIKINQIYCAAGILPASPAVQPFKNRRPKVKPSRSSEHTSDWRPAGHVAMKRDTWIQMDHGRTHWAIKWFWILWDFFSVWSINKKIDWRVCLFRQLKCIFCWWKRWGLGWKIHLEIIKMMSIPVSSIGSESIEAGYFRWQLQLPPWCHG